MFWGEPKSAQRRVAHRAFVQLESTRPLLDRTQPGSTLLDFCGQRATVRLVTLVAKRNLARQPQQSTMGEGACGKAKPQKSSCPVSE